jgi:hypothetical protein
MPRIAALALTLLLAACSTGDGPTGPDRVTELPQGSMRATIDGAAWSAATALVATYSGGVLAFAGTNNAYTIGMAVGTISGPGTFTIGSAGGTNALVNNFGGNSWHATPSNGSGTITITSISATAAVGTFTFTAPPVPGTGATGTKVVTNGSFNLKF